MKKKLIFSMLVLFLAAPLTAQEGFIGEIKMFAGNFAPRNWALCDGQILQISQYSALFSLLGTTYGGDGRTTFALPDLRGRVPIHRGTGPGLSTKYWGERGGQERVTLSHAQMPAHTHTAKAYADTSAGSSDKPKDMLPARNAAATPQYGNNFAALSNMNSAAVTVGSAGGSQAHENMQPYLTIHYIICLQGIYPSRN